MPRQRILPIREKDIQAAILQWLELHKYFCYRQNTGAFQNAQGNFYRFGHPGAPDIIVVANGRYIGIEVKAPHGQLSKVQEHFKDNLILAGGHYIVARQLEDVIDYFLQSKEK